MAVVDHAATSPIARAHAVEQLVALTCATTAEVLEVIVAMDRAEDYRADGALDMADWLVGTLHLSRPTARTWVRVAQALTTLPNLQGCFAAGELSWDQLVPATTFATPEDDEALALELPGCTVAEIETMARERRTRTRKNAEASHDRRYLRFRKDHDHDGFRITGFLPATEGELVRQAIARRAERAGAESGMATWAPFEQRSADALVDAFREAHDADPGADPTLVVVHVDHDVLRGIVSGNGSIDDVQVPSDTLDRLLCDSPVELNVEGPDGTCVGIGRAQRAVPRWLRRRIVHRDHGLCRFPGCGRKIRQVHHIDYWSRGGTTDSCNLAGLCFAHHHLVHEDGWSLKGNADGVLTFTSPHGRTLRSRPPPLDAAVADQINHATGWDLGHPHAG